MGAGRGCRRLLGRRAASLGAGCLPASSGRGQQGTATVGGPVLGVGLGLGLDRRGRSWRGLRLPGWGARALVSGELGVLLPGPGWRRALGQAAPGVGLLGAAVHLVLGLTAGVPWRHLMGRDEFRDSILHYPYRTVAVGDLVRAVAGRALCRLGRAVDCGVSRLGTAAAGQVGPALGLQVPVTVAPRAPLGLGDHRADLVGEVPGCDTVWGGRTVKGEDQDSLWAAGRSVHCRHSLGGEPLAEDVLRELVELRGPDGPLAAWGVGGDFDCVLLYVCDSHDGSGFARGGSLYL